MTKEKIYLGTFQGERYSLEKHSWDCGWYWGFGYVGNFRLYTHFSEVFLGKSFPRKKDFEELNFSEESWWVILDCFSQAYALKRAAEVYRHGAHIACDSRARLLVSEEMEKKLNQDLEKLLNFIWTFMLEKKRKMKLLLREEKREVEGETFTVSFYEDPTYPPPWRKGFTYGKVRKGREKGLYEIILDAPKDGDFSWYYGWYEAIEMIKQSASLDRERILELLKEEVKHIEDFLNGKWEYFSLEILHGGKKILRRGVESLPECLEPTIKGMIEEIKNSRPR
jgi:hypothetical protein